MTLSFVIPSRRGADRQAIKAELARLDLGGHDAEVFFVEGTLPPLQRNLAIRESTGEFVFLLDDDLILPTDLVTKTLKQFDGPRVAVVGGPNLTPDDDPPFAQMSGEVLASPLATGATNRRWRAGAATLDATEQELHGCFLCFRGPLLRQYLFVEDLFPNDENELMWRLRRDGHRMYYVPECWVYHKRRATLALHLKQVYISGRGRGELIRRSGIVGQWLYLGPSLWLSYLVALPLIIGRVPFAVWPVLAYLALAIGLSVWTWTRRRRPIFLATGALMAASHAAYAVGLIRGLFTGRGRTGVATIVEKWAAKG